MNDKKSFVLYMLEHYSHINIYQNINSLAMVLNYLVFHQSVHNVKNIKS